MDAPFDYVGQLLGASRDQLKVGISLYACQMHAHGTFQTIFCLLINFPLANLFIRLPKGYPVLKHVFNLSISAFYMFGLFRVHATVLQLLVSATATYLIVQFDKSKKMPWIVFG
jgi:lysophospholipid acyltransferase